MLKDAEKSKIDLILVKDLSRLGRNYVLLGLLLENILPEFNCRLIAINNNVDTLYPNSAAMDFSPFINIFNQHYSKNTSEKVKTARKSLAKRGMFLGTYAHYGYIKDPKDKYKLIPDIETASTVQEIFKMRAMGKSYRSIAMEFNRKNILSPRALYYLREHRESMKKENGLWSDSTVRGIIHSEVYIGNMVQMKKGIVSFKNKKVQAKENEEWVRVESTHEAIIDKSLWDTVSQMARTDFRIKAPKGNGNVSIFVGLLRGGDCGFNMRSLIEKRTNKAREENQYVSFMCNNTPAAVNVLVRCTASMNGN